MIELEKGQDIDPKKLRKTKGHGARLQSLTIQTVTKAKCLEIVQL